MKHRKYIFFVLYVLVLCAFQEVVFRFLFPLPEVDFNRINYMLVGHAGKDTKAIRNIKVMLASSPDQIRSIMTLNSYGFRDKNWQIAKTPGTERIFFVGDSFVEGDMASDDATIPKDFGEISAHGNIRVEAMNLGVSGSGFGEYLNLILDATPIFKPEWVFLVIYANDLPVPSISSRELTISTYDLFAPRLFQIFKMIRNHEMLPFRWPLRTIRFDQPVPNPNNPWSNTAYEQENKQYVTTSILTAMKKGDFNPARIGGSLYLEEALRTPFDITGILQFLQNFLREQHAQLCVFYIPERGQVTNFYRAYEKEYSIGFPEDIDLTQPEYQIHQRLLSEQCKRLGIRFLDLTPKIKAEETKGHHLYLHYDDHMTTKGYRLVAETMFDWWRANRTRDGGNRRVSPLRKP